jgi:hypothetical protein
MENSDQTLIFAYNANSGKWNAALDSAHKLLKPETYACNLCQLTYGIFSIKEDWKKFIDSLPISVTFLHKNEFYQKFPQYDQMDLPILIKKAENNELQTLISASEMQSFSKLEDLMNEIKRLITA